MVCDLAKRHRPAPRPSTPPRFSRFGPSSLSPLFSQPSVLPSLQPLCFDNHLDCLCIKTPNWALGPCFVHSRQPRRGFQSLQISRPNPSSVRIVALKESAWL